MTGVVRISIHDDEAFTSPVEDQVLRILIFLGRSAEKTARFLFAEDEIFPPGGPQTFQLELRCFRFYFLFQCEYMKKENRFQDVCWAIYNAEVLTKKADGSEEIKKAFKAGYFILTSGQLSPFYVDTRVIPSSPHEYCRVLNELKNEVNHLTDEIGINFYVSSESAGLAWGPW